MPETRKRVDDDGVFYITTDPDQHNLIYLSGQLFTVDDIEYDRDESGVYIQQFFELKYCGGDGYPPSSFDDEGYLKHWSGSNDSYRWTKDDYVIPAV